MAADRTVWVLFHCYDDYGADMAFPVEVEELVAIYAHEDVARNRAAWLNAQPGAFGYEAREVEVQTNG